MKVMDNAQMDFNFNIATMFRDCSHSLYHVHDVVQEREGNEMVVDAQTPALLLPLHRLAADDEDQGGGGEQEGLLVSGEGEHQHHRHHQQEASSESSTSSVSLSTAVITAPQVVVMKSSINRRQSTIGLVGKVRWISKKLWETNLFKWNPSQSPGGVPPARVEEASSAISCSSNNRDPGQSSKDPGSSSKDPGSSSKDLGGSSSREFGACSSPVNHGLLDGNGDARSRERWRLSLKTNTKIQKHQKNCECCPVCIIKYQAYIHEVPGKSYNEPSK